MDYNAKRKGLGLVQYLLIALLVGSIAYATIPLFREVNKAIVNNIPKKNETTFNQEGIVTESQKPESTMEPGDESAPPATPPTPPEVSTEEDGSGTYCGPFGCGTRCVFYAATPPPCEENICGIIPGLAGVLSDGCWICNHTSAFWEWETDLVTCNNFWYEINETICASQCTTEPLFNGPNYDDKYCYVCLNAAGAPDPESIGHWQRRGYEDDTAHADEMFDTGCTGFWTSAVQPANCRVNPITSASCGCTGTSPFSGALLSLQTPNAESCWICTGGDWINTIDIDPYCNQYWLDDDVAHCNSYTVGNAGSDNVDTVYNDFPFCGCKSEPPNNERGPDGRGAAGQCWVCDNSTSNWMKVDDVTACNDFWVNDNCPSSTPSYLNLCANALPTTPLPMYGCFLCTNPTENYRPGTYNNVGNPLYTGYINPCSFFWVNPHSAPYEDDYPPYLNIPNNPDDAETVCADPLPLLNGLKQPGIVEDTVNGTWGCHVCVGPTTANPSTPVGNYEWIYWPGGRFVDIPGPLYQACHTFWVEGQYLDAIPETFTEWMWQYGGPRYENDNNAYSDVFVDGSYIYVVGSESSVDPGATLNNIVVLKIDIMTGSPDWKKQVGPSMVEFGTFPRFLIASQGDYLYVSAIENVDSSAANESRTQYDVYVAKLDKATGGTEWQRQYWKTGSDNWYGQSMVADADALYLVTASDTWNETYVIRIDTDGNIEWVRQYGSSSFPWARLYHVALDGSDLYLFGMTGLVHPSDPANDLGLMRINKSNGAILNQWRFTHSPSKRIWQNNFIVSGGYAYMEAELSYNDPMYDDELTVIKFNTGTSLIDWCRYLHAPVNSFRDIAILNNELYFSGYFNPGMAKMYEGILMRMDQNGDAVWIKQIGGSANERLYSLDVDASTVISTGFESSDPRGGWYDIFVARLDKNGPGYGDDLSFTIDNTTADWATVASSIASVDATADFHSLALSSSVTIPNNTDVENPDTSLWVDLPVDWTLSYTIEWKHQYGGEETDRGTDLTMQNGYIYVTGIEWSADDAGDINDQGDAFIMKVDAYTGTVIWKKRYGTDATEKAEGIVVDANYIYVAITQFETTDSTASGTTVNDDIALLKVREANGQIEWVKKINTTTGALKNDTVKGLFLRSGYLYLTGWHANITNAYPSWDVIVMKINATSGAVTWRYAYGFVDSANNPDTIMDWGVDIWVSEDSNSIYVTGVEDNDDDNSTGTGNSHDIFVMGLDGNGNLSWAKQYGTDNDYRELDGGRALWLDETVSTPVLYVTGYEARSATYQDDKAVFLMALNPANGSVNWKRNYYRNTTGKNQQLGDSLFVDSSYIYMGGIYYNGSDYDLFVMRLNKTTGASSWRYRIGGSEDEATVYDINDEHVYGTKIYVDNYYLYLVGLESSDPEGSPWDTNTPPKRRHDILLMRKEIGGTSNLTWTTEGAITDWNKNGENITISWGKVPYWDRITWTPSVTDVTATWGSALPINSGANKWTLEGIILDTEKINAW